MTLHDAIIEVLKGDTSLTTREIAIRINRARLYTKGDGKPVSTSQISARVNKYPDLFEKYNGHISLPGFSSKSNTSAHIKPPMLDVKQTIEQILPDPDLRIILLQIFAECITKADQFGNNKWGVHLHTDRIRLLVGSLIVCTIHTRRFWLALDSKTLEKRDNLVNRLDKSRFWEWDNGYPEYKVVPSRNGYFNPDEQSSDLWEDIKPLHFEIIHKAAEKYTSLKINSRYNHRDELLGYIEQILNISLPKPEYGPTDSTRNVLSDIKAADHQLKNITTTERENIILSRIGQGLFRTFLKKLWDNRCAVTNCRKTELLRASHIKPWRDSNNRERIDQFNGFLLTPNIDAAFDQGYISFTDDGSIQISHDLTLESRKKLGIHDDLKLRFIKDQHKIYLEYHRHHIFRNNQAE